MVSSIFLNMPVADVERSKNFFVGLGFTVNEQFTGDDAACIVISPTISAMLCRTDKFKSFIDKDIALSSSSEVILSLACESAAEVLGIAEKAFAQGARKVNEPDDNDFMFSWAFEDLDGHLWDLFWIKNS